MMGGAVQHKRHFIILSKQFGPIHGLHRLDNGLLILVQWSRCGGEWGLTLPPSHRQLAKYL